MNASCLSVPQRRAVFLDRDGVINRKLPGDRYVTAPSEFQLLPGVAEALAIMRELGFLLVVTTNQRGVGRGFMTPEDLDRVHLHMEKELAKHGIRFDGVYHCPHRRREACSCRKPEPGMLLAAGKELSLDLANSYMAGDSATDIEAGRRAGAHTVLIGDGDKGNAEAKFSSLLDFALFMKNRLDPSQSADHSSPPVGDHS
jgi:D-glycero-D-manno-heptose 1,7-bisphosphate phosphatase